MRQLHPPRPGELDVDDLIELYAPGDRARRWLRVNMVESVDGAVSLDGVSAGLSSEADKTVFKLLRMHCDVLLVGAGTVRTEGYRELRLGAERVRWREAHGLPGQPVMAVVSRTADLDPAAPLFTRAPRRPVVLTCESAPRNRVDALRAVSDVVVHGDDSVDFARAVDALAERGLAQILCEGGPLVLGALTAADQVDELCVTLSPLLAGPGARRITDGPATPVARRLSLAHALYGDDNLLLRYVRLQ